MVSRIFLFFTLFSQIALGADDDLRKREREFQTHPADDAICADYLRFAQRAGLAFRTVRNLGHAAKPGGMFSADGTQFVFLERSEGSFKLSSIALSTVEVSQPHSLVTLPQTEESRHVEVSSILALSHDGGLTLVGYHYPESDPSAIMDMTVVNTATGAVVRTLNSNEYLNLISQVGQRKIIAMSPSGTKIAVASDQRPASLVLLFSRTRTRFYYRTARETDVTSLAFEGERLLRLGWINAQTKESGVVQVAVPSISEQEYEVLRNDGSRLFLKTREASDRKPLILSSRSSGLQCHLESPFRVEGQTNVALHTDHNRIIWQGEGSKFRLYKDDGLLVFDGDAAFIADRPLQGKVRILNMAVRPDGRVVAHVEFPAEGQFHEALMLSDFVVR